MLGHGDFQASNRWLELFKKRNQLVGKSVCGESGSVDVDITRDWVEVKLPKIIEDYEENDIFNADESGVFFKALPNKNIALKNEPCTGGKQSKERITILPFANMNGSEKETMIVTGKSANPQCFKNIKRLPVTYYFNKKAWMVSQLFEIIMVKFDQK